MNVEYEAECYCQTNQNLVRLLRLRLRQPLNRVIADENKPSLNLELSASPADIEAGLTKLVFTRLVGLTMPTNRILGTLIQHSKCDGELAMNLEFHDAAEYRAVS